MSLPSTTNERKVPFKNPEYQKKKSTLDKKRALTKIISLEKSMPWDSGSVHFSAIDAPPPLKPIKKYSDISGFVSKYKDPKTGLLYAFAEEYFIIKSLSSDIVAGYLALRKANPN